MSQPPSLTYGTRHTRRPPPRPSKTRASRDTGSTRASTTPRAPAGRPPRVRLHRFGVDGWMGSARVLAKVDRPTTPNSFPYTHSQVLPDAAVRLGRQLRGAGRERCPHLPGPCERHAMPCSNEPKTLTRPTPTHQLGDNKVKSPGTGGSFSSITCECTAIAQRFNDPRVRS